MLGLCACATRVGDFTIISTKNVEVGAKYVRLGTFEGKDSIPVILFPIGQPNMKEAVDDCLKNGKGDMLTNAVVYFNNNSFFFGVQAYTVKGDVWIRADHPNAANTSELYRFDRDSDGNPKLVSMMNPTVTIAIDAVDGEFSSSLSTR